MTLDVLLGRLVSARKRTIRYRLGAGGMNPAAPTPANFDGRCDCSGFVCWALGISRFTQHPLYVAFNGGWINTDAILWDASKQAGFFELWGKLVGTTAVRGQILVYGRRGKTPGHVGIVSGPECVVHCSAGNDRRNPGRAVAETDLAVFRARSDCMIVSYVGI